MIIKIIAVTIFVRIHFDDEPSYSKGFQERERERERKYTVRCLID